MRSTRPGRWPRVHRRWSSWAWAAPARPRCRPSRPSARCLPADVREAGELLHYGMGAIRPDALVVLVSQSGRSVETVAVAARLRAAGHPRIVVVTNDEASPMASAADVVLPMLAGDEATVATKTWVTTFSVLGLLARALVERIRNVPPARRCPARDARRRGPDGRRGRRGSGGWRGAPRWWSWVEGRRSPRRTTAR